MRGLLLSLALCCLVHHATTQEVTVGGITYSIYTAGSAIDITSTDPCDQPGETLAVFETPEQYTELIKEMIDEDVDDGNIHVGLCLQTPGDAILRTFNENGNGRPAPFNNFPAGVTKTLPQVGCAYMDFDKTDITAPFADFEQSPWSFDTDLDLAIGDKYLCMDAPNPDCVGDECHDTRKDNRHPDDKTCFWKPKHCLLSWKEAKEVCYKHGGHLMNLIDDTDIDTIGEWTKDDPSSADYWLGLIQEPEEGHPTWWDGQPVDEQEAWASGINYLGHNQSPFFPYAGIYHTEDHRMNLYQIATLGVGAATGSEVKAFATCEATLEHYCIYSSKKVKHAQKSVCCDDEKLRYTCDPGFEFPDGDIVKEIDCECDHEFDDVPDCILKNPCIHDYHLCQPHGECVFTNQYQRPYYCVCGPGYKLEEGSHSYCVDIDECEQNKCGHYKGNCINTVGSYWCTCKQGWENGVCAQQSNTIVSVHTMTIYFNVKMNFAPDMNEPSSEDYEHFREALEEITQGVYYEDRISMVDFHVSEEEFGKMKVKVVFDLYFASDVKTVSEYVWKFYNYIRHADYFMVNGNPYPYYGSIYFQSPTISSNIAITSACSIYDHIGQCHGSYCQANHNTPVCHCQPGYHGEFCDEKKPHGNLSDIEIGLIVAMCFLFVMLLCLPCCIICCYMHCRCFHSRKRVHPHEKQYVASNVYGHSPSYVKTTQVATRYNGAFARVGHA